jgi:hypothetical protein
VRRRRFGARKLWREAIKVYLDSTSLPRATRKFGVRGHHSYALVEGTAFERKASLRLSEKLHYVTERNRESASAATPCVLQADYRSKLSQILKFCRKNEDDFPHGHRKQVESLPN